MWEQIRQEDWSLVNGNLSGWPQRLWNFDKHHQYIGVSGGSGIGYGTPASIGAALANRKYGRLSVNIQNDGDMMYAPGVLWTAAHHKIPILTVVHNNRATTKRRCTCSGWAIAAIVASIARTSATRSTTRRSTTRSSRRAMGCYAEGPIADPNDLGRRSHARSPPSSAASRHSSTWSRRRDERKMRTGKTNRNPHVHRRMALAAAIILSALSAGRSSSASQAPAAIRAPAPASSPTGNAASGKTLYSKDGCSECHGNEGQGAPSSGPRIAPDPLPLAAFMGYVRAPRGQMPPYTTKVLPDAQLGDIYEFMRTRPPAASIDGLLPPLK